MPTRATQTGSDQAQTAHRSVRGFDEAALVAPREFGAEHEICDHIKRHVCHLGLDVTAIAVAPFRNQPHGVAGDSLIKRCESCHRKRRRRTLSLLCPVVPIAEEESITEQFPQHISLKIRFRERRRLTHEYLFDPLGICDHVRFNRPHVERRNAVVGSFDSRNKAEWIIGVPPTAPKHRF